MSAIIYDKKDLILIYELMRNLTTRSHLIYDVFDYTHWHIDEVLSLKTSALQDSMAYCMGEDIAEFIMKNKKCFYYSDASIVYFRINDVHGYPEKPWMYAFPDVMEIRVAGRDKEIKCCSIPKILFLKVLYYSGDEWAFKDRDKLLKVLANEN